MSVDPQAWKEFLDRVVEGTTMAFDVLLLEARIDGLMAEHREDHDQIARIRAILDSAETDAEVVRRIREVLDA